MASCVDQFLSKKVLYPLSHIIEGLKLVENIGDLKFEIPLEKIKPSNLFQLYLNTADETETQ